MFENLFTSRVVAPQVPLGMRHWESAETTRLNSAHWTYANGASINERLTGSLAKLRQRSEYEIANNPIVEGIVRTYCGDLIDKQGPVLSVQSDDNGFNESLEDSWFEWWAMPDAREKFAGVDLLALWIESLWSAGEYLIQLTKDSDAEGVQLRLQTVHARRLDTPLDKAGDPEIVMGVGLTDIGKPVAYYIAKEDPLAGGAVLSKWGDAQQAENVIHAFLARECDQVRGVPLLAGVLQTAADIRDYDAQVLDAARLAADWAGFLTNKDAEAETPTLTTGSTLEIERRSLMTCPPGWGVDQMNSHQPSAQYVEYRHERMRELGRGVSMPLMMILLDAGRHNYSSARFDAQLYQRGLKRVQGWLERCTLNRLVGLVARESVLAGQKKAPKRVRYSWTWPVMPHVDPVKEAKAEEIRLANATLAPSDALAAHGKDLEEHLAKLEKEWGALEAVGVVPPWKRKSVTLQAEAADKE